MDHVRPVLVQNVCDSTREEEIMIGFATAISRIFVGKETELLYGIMHNVLKAQKSAIYMDSMAF